MPPGSSANCLTASSATANYCRTTFHSFNSTANQAPLLGKQTRRADGSQVSSWTAAMELGWFFGLFVVFIFVCVCEIQRTSVWTLYRNSVEDRMRKTNNMIYTWSDWDVASSAQRVMYYLSHYVSHCSSYEIHLYFLENPLRISNKNASKWTYFHPASKRLVSKWMQDRVTWRVSAEFRGSECKTCVIWHC